MSRRKQARPAKIQEQQENIKPTKDPTPNDDDANNNLKLQGQLEKEEREKAAALQTLLANLQWPAATPNVTTEALQNTKVAVAQFAANALASGAVGDNVQDLAVLQSTLFTLQQQQLLQLQLIHQLQQQLSDTSSRNSDEEDDSPPPSRPPSPLKQECKGLTTTLRNSNLTSSDGLNPAFASLLNCANQDPNRPLSPGGQQLSINNQDEPNTLEMLQKRAQEVLDSASQGLLASSLADDPRKKMNYEKGREPFFKHRCRYCGKVFGSDSALQIHIRSHTGERPFKCNVCGSRFTTKGNLKVHFQRHTSKFPHVKMNPHPVPESMDHFHPPLLSGSNSGGHTTPEILSPQFHNPIFRFQHTPQDLTIPKDDHYYEKPTQSNFSPSQSKNYSGNNSPISNDSNSPDEESPILPPENNPPDNPPPPDQQIQIHPESSSESDSPQINPTCDEHPPNSPDSPQIHTDPHLYPPHEMNFDPSKDPAIYTNLLPRPGSNDNAWESLIEVTKTSETSKLQQLVDNIEHKLTDPNQCIICHRVLSCKSALQMHYRTHTGERPFKCKICGRAFTTKGNLKTHMGVHRAKPPLRVLHQCPVCHKRFTNSLVLQQHIRLHTGEPTDLTPDQIRAAEVRDFSFTGFSPNFMHTPNSLISNDDQQSINKSDDDDDDDDNDEEELDINDEKPSTSLAALENQVRTITTSFASQMLGQNKTEEEAEDLTKDSSLSSTPPPPPPPPPPLPSTNFALDLTPRTSTIFNPFTHIHPQSLITPTTLNSIANAVLNSTQFPPPPPPIHRQFEEGYNMWSSRGSASTTCQICLKTFACNSALEIHYRSHTKERPFKCNVCDRGFSTKGNMKQHMLTHKIRDATSNSSFESTTTPTPHGQSDSSADINKSEDSSPSIKPDSPLSNNSEPPNKKINIGSPSEDMKHMCKVCTKNFSSSSALHIHSRTHTGDRPFKCNVCQKAFTTKGNLKVHMGTHMWTNGVSRRGRRMSLDPLSVFLPINTNTDIEQRNFFPFNLHNGNGELEKD